MQRSPFSPLFDLCHHPKHVNGCVHCFVVACSGDAAAATKASRSHRLRAAAAQAASASITAWSRCSEMARLMFTQWRRRPSRSPLRNLPWPRSPVRCCCSDRATARECVPEQEPAHVALTSSACMPAVPELCLLVWADMTPPRVRHVRGHTIMRLARHNTCISRGASLLKSLLLRVCCANAACEWVAGAATQSLKLDSERRSGMTSMRLSLTSQVRELCSVVVGELAPA